MDTPQRNLVVFMDGTGNAPKAAGNTNVLRLYGMVEKDDPERQLAFYTQGVGTRGDPAALLGPVRRATKILGLITGYGMRRDISDAYQWLVRTYRPGDRIFIFGFSRGAFAALALTGALRLFGLVRSDVENMSGFVTSGIAKPLRRSNQMASYLFRGRFARRAGTGKHWFVVPVHFLGLFDAVKALKYFRYWLRIKESWLKKRYFESWPFTGKPDLVTTLRHAVAIDDRRIPYDVFPIDPEKLEDFNEVWFAGVHSDVGGSFGEQKDGSPSDPKYATLGRIALKWMVEAAVDKGLQLRQGKYAEFCEFDTFDDTVTPNRNSFVWLLMGWRRRLHRRPFRRRYFRAPWKWFSAAPEETIKVHQSVHDLTNYALPKNAANVVTVDPDWQKSRPQGHPHG